MVAGLRGVSWSCTEIAALATKAARGAGAPPLQAARFGQAAVQHLLQHREVPDLQAALSSLPGGPITTFPRVLDAALAQSAHSNSVEIGVAYSSLLESYAECLAFQVALKDCDGTCLVTVHANMPDAPAIAGRISGCDALLVQMEALAERTFVPETEQSRSIGAGAGLTDND